jgi:hypothetical protein
MAGWPVRCALAGTLLSMLAGSLHAQARRDPAVQPVIEIEAGDLLVGAGLGYEANRSFPLSGLSGDLWSLGRLTFVYGLARAVAIEVRGDLQHVLTIEGRGESAIELSPATDGASTSDFGDFRVGVLLMPFGGSEGLSGGAHVQVTLPNSDEKKGIGTNTTDVRLSLLGSYGSGPLRVTADVGVAILEAPLQTFEQNDVLAYSGELLYRTGHVRLALGVDGRASTRGRVPIGTEDLGEVRTGFDVRFGAWLLDAEVAAGYAGSSSDWAFRAGAAYALR